MATLFEIDYLTIPLSVTRACTARLFMAELAGMHTPAADVQLASAEA